MEEREKGKSYILVHEVMRRKEVPKAGSQTSRTDSRPQIRKLVPC